MYHFCGDVDNGACVGAGDIREISVFSSQFYCELKTIKSKIIDFFLKILFQLSLSHRMDSCLFSFALGASAWGGQGRKGRPGRGSPSAHRLASSSRHRY